METQILVEADRPLHIADTDVDVKQLLQHEGPSRADCSSPGSSASFIDRILAKRCYESTNQTAIPQRRGLVEMSEEFGELVLPVVGKFRTRTSDP